MLTIARGLLAVLLLLPAGAFAQTASPPLVVERVDNPFVVAPDYKVTRLNRSTGQLAGAYVGRVLDDVLFIGGAGYWLVNGSRGDELAYGGVLIGWSAPERAGVRFGGRGLVGVGSATLGRDITIPGGVRAAGIRFGGPQSRQPSGTFRLLARDDFFVFEPEVTAGASLFRHVGLNIGAGYRVTGFADALDDRVRGATGSIALQLGW